MGTKLQHVVGGGFCGATKPAHIVKTEKKSDG